MLLVDEMLLSWALLTVTNNIVQIKEPNSWGARHHMQKTRISLSLHQVQLGENSFLHSVEQSLFHGTVGENRGSKAHLNNWKMECYNEQKNINMNLKLWLHKMIGYSLTKRSLFYIRHIQAHLVVGTLEINNKFMSSTGSNKGFWSFLRMLTNF